MFVDDERDPSSLPYAGHLIFLQCRGLPPACFRLDGKELPFMADKKIGDATLSECCSQGHGVPCPKAGEDAFDPRFHLSFWCHENSLLYQGRESFLLYLKTLNCTAIRSSMLNVMDPLMS